MVSIIFLVCIPLYHRYPCRFSGLPATLEYSIIVPVDTVLLTWPLMRTTWWTMSGSPGDEPRCSLLSPSQGVHVIQQVIDFTHLRPKAMIIAVAYVCVTFYVYRMLSWLLCLLGVDHGFGPMSQSHSLLPHSLWWAHGFNFSFSVLEEFTKQRYAQKSDLSGDMDGSLFHLSFCVCWLYSPLILNFTRICFCMKSISLLEGYEI